MLDQRPVDGASARLRSYMLCLSHGAWFLRPGLAILVLLACPFPDAPARTLQAGLTQQVSAAAGERASLQLVLSDAGELSAPLLGFNLTLGFDASRLRFEAARIGVSLNQTPGLDLLAANEPHPGSVAVGVILGTPGGVSVTDGTVLLEIDFVVDPEAADGIAVVDVVQLLLGERSLAVAGADPADGSIAIGASAEPLQVPASTWPTLLVLGLLLRRAGKLARR